MELYLFKAKLEDINSLLSLAYKEFTSFLKRIKRA